MQRWTRAPSWKVLELDTTSVGEFLFIPKEGEADNIVSRESSYKKFLHVCITKSRNKGFMGGTDHTWFYLTLL